MTQNEPRARWEQRERRLRRTLGVAAGLFVGPMYLVLVVTALHWLEPRALGTYSFLVGGPLLLALLASLATGGGFTRTLLGTLTGITLLGGALYLARLESGICLLVLLAPFLMLGSLFSLLIGFFELRRVQRALRSTQGLLLLSLLPLGGALGEHTLLAKSSSREVGAFVDTSAPPSRIWAGIVRVSTLTEEEIPPTWLQPLGIPRPVRATFEETPGGGLRVGHFEDGLRFLERATTFSPERELGLSVEVDLGSLDENNPLQHGLTQGFFQLDDVRYRIQETNGSARLSLNCRYTVHTTVSPYAHLVTGVILETFEDSLLRALAARFERGEPPSGTRLIAASR